MHIGLARTHRKFGLTHDKGSVGGMPWGTACHAHPFCCYLHKSRKPHTNSAEIMTIMDNPINSCHAQVEFWTMHGV